MRCLDRRFAVGELYTTFLMLTLVAAVEQERLCVRANPAVILAQHARDVNLCRGAGRIPISRRTISRKLA